MRLHTSCILAAAIALHAAWADTPRFDRVFGSHMVLPHGKNIPVSGTAAPNREITVTFGNTALKTKTDSKGKWSVTLPPMPPCATGQTLAAVQHQRNFLPAVQHLVRHLKVSPQFFQR